MAIWSVEINELKKLIESFKSQFPELEKELEQLIKSEDPNVILLYSKRCLEVIITDLCECELKRPRKTEPLKGIIDKLHKEEKVPSNIITSMDHLNSLSAYGAHPKDFEPEQVKPVLVNLDIIIKWYLKYKEFDFIYKTRVDELKFESRPAPEKSILVLPFENISPDQDQEYFSDGLTEEIITDLSHIGDLLVISRSSAMTFKGTKKKIVDIAKEVNVRYVLEGSVRKAGNNLRITAQLINGTQDSHIWAEKYSGTLDDIFDIQEKVSRSIAESLKLQISSKEKEFLSKNPTDNLEAYNMYLKGRFFSYTGTNEGLVKSIECYEKALSLDPDYALAYSGLADSYYVMAAFRWLPLEEGISKAKYNAIRALNIENNMAEPHSILGVIYGSYDWEYEMARKELARAIRLNPKYMIAHQYYTGLLDALRQNEEARLHINIAKEIDPSFFYLYLISSQLYYNTGKLVNALNDCLKSIEMNPGFLPGYWRALRILIKQNEGLKAFDLIKNYLKNESNNGKQIETLTELYSTSGLQGIIKWAITWETKCMGPNLYLLAVWHIFLKKKDLALTYLEEAVEKRFVAIPAINNDPDFDILRINPRFQTLIKKMGLSEYQTPQ